MQNYDRVSPVQFWKKATSTVNFYPLSISFHMMYFEKSLITKFKELERDLGSKNPDLSFRFRIVQSVDKYELQIEYRSGRENCYQT